MGSELEVTSCSKDEGKEIEEIRKFTVIVLKTSNIIAFDVGLLKYM